MSPDIVMCNAQYQTHFQLEGHAVILELSGTPEV